MQMPLKVTVSHFQGLGERKTNPKELHSHWGSAGPGWGWEKPSIPGSYRMSCHAGRASGMWDKGHLQVQTGACGRKGEAAQKGIVLCKPGGKWEKRAIRAELMQNSLPGGWARCSQEQLVHLWACFPRSGLLGIVSTALISRTSTACSLPGPLETSGSSAVTWNSATSAL